MAYDGSQSSGVSESPKRGLNDRACHWKKKAERAFQEQAPFLSRWQAEAEMFYPSRASFTMEWGPGQERDAGLFTGEPQMMRRTLGDNIGAMSRPRGRDWFNVVARPEEIMDEDEVQRWLQRATRTQRAIVYDPKAQFTKQLALSDHDFVTFGNAVIRHVYNRDHTGMLYTCLHLRDCAWSVNDEGVVDTFFYRRKMRLCDLEKVFGKENLPRKWRELLDKKDGNPYQEMPFTVATAPIEEGAYEPRDTPMKGFRFAAVYIADCDEKDCGLGEGYYRSFPYTVRRWDLATGETYGTSPCVAVANPESRSLNVSEQATLQGIEWAVDPPKFGAESALANGFSLVAGEINPITDDWKPKEYGKPIQNIDTGEPRYGMEFARDRREFLARAFFQNLLKLPDKEMTAYEVGEQLDMFAREAAPIFEPLEADNSSMMEATFDRAWHKGAFGPLEEIPELLQGAETEFEFDTPLSQALRRKKVNDADQFIVRLTSMAEIEPTVVDNVDFDTLSRDVMEATLPNEWRRKPEEVAAMREARAQDQAEQENAARMQQVMDTAAKANPENLRRAEQAIREGGG